ncbi:uncharacterized protein LOC115577771 [Sparus aurata]|uniref:uncharacterized protein LOC115577771 n=1 Tax=Sparus aurata TaxID=8175 RepID=UPI0011C1135D|nr:uncharacterized protein LOC115577771 [Sparus aurata]
MSLSVMMFMMHLSLLKNQTTLWQNGGLTGRLETHGSGKDNTSGRGDEEQCNIQSSPQSGDQEIDQTREEGLETHGSGKDNTSGRDDEEQCNIQSSPQSGDQEIDQTREEGLETHGSGKDNTSGRDDEEQCNIQSSPHSGDQEIDQTREEGLETHGSGKDNTSGRDDEEQCNIQSSPQSGDQEIDQTRAEGEELQSEHQQCSIFSESDKEQQPLSGHGPTKLDTEPTIQNDIDTLLEEAGPPPPLLSQEKSLSVEVSETLTLQSLWKRNDTEVVVAVIPSVNRAGCSFLIHHSELCSLRPHEWLTGEVMEGLFHVYAKRFNLGRSVLILNHYTAGVILFGTPDKVRQHSLRRTDFSNYEAVLSFVNVGGVHWKLLFVLPAMKAVFLLDPMANNSEQAESADAAKRIRDYMRFRMITLGKNDWGRLRWRGLTMDHPVQQDKCSCGVIVTKMAKAVMEAFPALPAMSFGTSMKEMASERTNFAQALLSDSVLDLDHHCVMCCASKPPVSGPPVTRWIQCDTCERWYHEECLDLEEEILKKARAGNWNCDLCK